MYHPILEARERRPGGGAISTRGYFSKTYVTFPMEPPRIPSTVLKRAKGKEFSLTIRSVTEKVQPLVEKCFPSYIVQLRYFRSCMENMRYFEKHDKAAGDHKETAFKIALIKAEEKNLGDGESLDKKKVEDLELLKDMLEEYSLEKSEYASKVKNNYERFVGEAMKLQFEGIANKKLYTVTHHKVHKWKLRRVVFKEISDGEDMRTPTLDSLISDKSDVDDDKLPDGHYAKWYPVWKSDKVDAMVGTTMDGVLRCINLHKFELSNGYGRAEAQRKFMFSHIGMPADLSMDVQAVADLIEAISGYMEDLPSLKDHPDHEDNDEVERANVPFTQLEKCEILKAALPIEVLKLLESRTKRDELFFDFKDFTEKCIGLNDEVRNSKLNATPPKKTNKNGKNNSPQSNSNKNQEPTSNGNTRHCSRCKSNGKGDRTYTSHNDKDCKIFNADGSAKAPGKPKKKVNNHNKESLRDLVRKELASHRRSRGRRRSYSSDRSRSRSRSESVSESDESQASRRSRRRSKDRRRSSGSRRSRSSRRKKNDSDEEQDYWSGTTIDINSHIAEDIVEPKSKRIKICHIDSPIKSTNSHFRRTKEAHATIRERIIRGKGLKTVAVASPIYAKQGSTKSKDSERIYRVLLDSGSDGDIAFITEEELSKFNVTQKAYPDQWGTSTGSFETTELVHMDVLLPEFSQTKIMSTKADVKIVKTKDKPSYDLIIGIETLAKWRAKFDFIDRIVTLDGESVPMKPLNAFSDPRRLYNIYREATEPAVTKAATERVCQFLEAKYEKADLPSVVEDNCPHLTDDQREALLKLLQKHESLFEGKLGQWDGDFAHFELKPNAKPFRASPFPVPRIHRDTIKRELKRLCELGVIEEIEGSEWAAPSFFIAKPDGTGRFLTDFRGLNSQIVRKPYPLPKISDILQQMEGFSYATALDLNMGYYHIVLDAASADICAIVFPWGFYRYKRLPMGVAASPDIFQAKMNSLFNELEYVRAYLDDLLVITKGDIPNGRKETEDDRNTAFQDHLQKLDVVLQKLRDKGLQVNVRKSNFAAEEIDYLGYTLSRQGIQPQKKKVSAILALKPPKNVKELRRVLGIIQYYRDLWERRTDLLAPLTDLVGECGTTKKQRKQKTKSPVKWHWDDKHQKAFDEIKKVIARDVVLAYPNFDDEFVIYTDASTRQLGGVITQNNRPIAFFSRKLTKAQTKYTVTELELLSIVELLKEFKGMLLGQRIVVWTDHQNLIRDSLGNNSDRVMRWNLLLQEYNPDVRYIKGEENTVADAISRLDYCPKTNPHPEDELDDGGEWKHNFEHVKWNNMMTLMSHYQHKEDVDDNEGIVAEGPRYKEVLAHVFQVQKEEEDNIYPVTTQEIADAQRADPKLKKLFKRPDYERGIKPVQVDDETILVKTTKSSSRIRFVIPDALQNKVLQWYHHYLQHPGRDRMEETLCATMWWYGMRTHIKDLCRTCDRCQKGKKRKRSYAHLPPKEAVTRPWRTVCVDLIGNYEIRSADGTVLEFACLTMIDPATGWFEIIELPTREIIEIDKKTGKEVVREIIDKTSSTISYLFNKAWLSRYPRPRYVVCDNGSEFKLHLKELCKQYSVKRKPTTSKNPQANAILERMHGVFGDMMRTSNLNNLEHVDSQTIDEFITNAAWAIRSSYHTVLKATPGAAIFGRDMLFDLPYIANWDEIGKRRQKQVDANNVRENKKRLPYDYVVGNKVLLINEINGEKAPKANDKNDGPYVITQVYCNGTVRIQRGSINERLNVRRLTPYFENSNEEVPEGQD